MSKQKTNRKRFYVNESKRSWTKLCSAVGTKSFFLVVGFLCSNLLFAQPFDRVGCDFGDLNSRQKKLLESAFVLMEQPEWQNASSQKARFYQLKSDLELLDCYLFQHEEKQVQAQFALFLSVIFKDYPSEKAAFESALRRAYTLKADMSPRSRIQLFTLMGENVKRRFNLLDAIFFYKNVERIASEQQDSLNLTRATMEIGVCYRDLKQYEASRKYLKKAEKLVGQIHNSVEEYWPQLHLGVLYRQEGDFQKAEKTLQAAIEKYGLLARNPEVLSHFQKELGLNFMAQEKYDLAKNHFLNVVKNLESEPLEKQFSLVATYHQLGVIAKVNRQNEEAKTYFRKAFQKGNALNHPFDAAESAKQLYALLDRTDPMRDEIFAAVSNLQDKDVFFKVDSDQLHFQLNEVSQIEGKVAVEEEKSENFRMIVLGLVPLLLSLLVVIYILYRKKKRDAAQQEELLEYNVKINNANAKLNEALNELDRFTSHVAHDIKSSIVSLQKGVQSIPYTSDELSPKTLKVLDELEKETNELFDFVDFLLQKAKKDQSQLTDPREFELIDVVVKVMNNLSKTYDLTACDINYEWKLPTFMGESLPIFQLLKNLLENAIKYQSPERKLVVNIAMKKENGVLTIQIRDNGRGIAESKQKEIFDIFRQSQKGDDLIGSGVGLSICKSIVDEYNGRINVDSQLGIGTTFTIILTERTRVEGFRS